MAYYPTEAADPGISVRWALEPSEPKHFRAPLDVRAGLLPSGDTLLSRCMLQRRSRHAGSFYILSSSIETRFLQRRFHWTCKQGLSFEWSGHAENPDTVEVGTCSHYSPVTASTSGYPLRSMCSSDLPKACSYLVAHKSAQYQLHRRVLVASLWAAPIYNKAPAGNAGCCHGRDQSWRAPPSHTEPPTGLHQRLSLPADPAKLLNPRFGQDLSGSSCAYALRP